MMSPELQPRSFRPYIASSISSPSFSSSPYSPNQSPNPSSHFPSTSSSRSRFATASFAHNTRVAFALVPCAALLLDLGGAPVVATLTLGLMMAHILDSLNLKSGAFFGVWAYLIAAHIDFFFSSSCFVESLLGMASALETLCGQAYGAKQYHMLGVYLQRSWIVLISSAVLLLPLFFFTSPILKALDQEDYIAEASGYISLWLIPVLFSFIPSFTFQVFLQAQSKNMIISYLAALTFAIHLFLSWLLTVKYKFGIPGAILSTILLH